MDFKTLLLEVERGVAQITLNRPEQLNAIHMQAARELMQAAIYCDEDPSVRSVLLCGAGRVFCGGGDLKGFSAENEALPGHIKELTTYLHAAVSRLARMDAPVVAAVQGSAAGAGMSLALSSDLVLAGESARFVLAYGRIGLCPDGSASYFLPRLVGLRRALELALTSRTLSAQEALDWGLVTAVVPDDQLLSRARVLAEELAAGPTRALGAAKRLLREAGNETLETQMERESRALADLARTIDAREGISAFLEKRSPRFQGR